MLYETIAFPDNAPLQCSIVEVEEYPFHMHDDVLEIMFALEGSFELTVVKLLARTHRGTNCLFTDGCPDFHTA